MLDCQLILSATLLFKNPVPLILQFHLTERWVEMASKFAFLSIVTGSFSWHTALALFFLDSLFPCFLHFLFIHCYYGVAHHCSICCLSEQYSFRKGVAEHHKFQERDNFIFLGPNMLYLYLCYNCTCLLHSGTSMTHDCFSQTYLFLQNTFLTVHHLAMTLKRWSLSWCPRPYSS